ncbi:MAG TPA: cytochrome c [Lentimicrobium sp.]|nr:cytochrome c [Lentimicrobium sp.]
MKNYILTLIALVFAISVSAQQKQPSWKAPDKYKTMVQKEKGDLAVGKELYNKNCKSCHGAKGLGDGPKAASLKTFPGNFTDAAFKKHTFGEIYYISFVGSGEMPNYEKKIVDEGDRTSIVEYIKSLK